MFPKPAFGSNATSGFGSFNSGATTASPFGGFKPTTATFGASTSAQPATGGGLFANNTSGGLFGNPGPSTSTSAFGTTNTGFGFGGGGTTTGGLFGNTSATGGGLFGNTQATPSFGVKPTGFGFGNAATTGAQTGSLFGTPATGTGTGLFAPQNNTMTGGGLFGANTNTGAFGQQQQAGTGHVKYNPVVGTEMVMKNGTSQNINIKHHCITYMKEYESKSLEELRLEDYMAGRKGSTTNTGMFGGFQQTTENKPLFGSTGFGQTATTSAPSMFGTGTSLGGTTGGFGQASTFSFGGNTNTTTTGLFGANKPTFGTSTAGTGLFSTTTTQAPLFGSTNTNTFGFGANTQNQSTGIFGAKPATGAFGATPASSGFGSFTSGAFQAKTTAPAFGTTTPAFGTMAPAFGANTQTTGLFGQNSAFGKPATTQPSFGFTAQQPAAPGLNTGLGGNMFQSKPLVPSFGNLGTNTFQQQPATTFKTDNVLGGGMFGNTSTLGSGFGLGTGLNANNSLLGNNSLSGASAGGNVHEQILTMAARPYGDSPLFKDLLPDSSTTAEEILKPTNPLALKAVLEGSQSAYKVSSPTTRVQPRQLPIHKKSLFDGLEESDSSLEDKLCLKPSRKRLVLRAQSNENRNEDFTNNRSFEQQPTGPVQTQETSTDQVDRSPDVSRTRISTSDIDNVDLQSEKHNRWSNTPKISSLWADNKEKPETEIGNRIYPNIEKEVSDHVTERRSSWLTTKPLRKNIMSSNPDAVESSVRELGVRNTSMEKDSNNTLSVSEDENVAPRDAPPHPTGVKLTRPGYYTIPTLDDMINYMRSDGTCIVPHLTIGRKNYGNVYYDSEIDVAGLDLDALVHFLNKEVIIYPEDSDKPPVGVSLNRRAIVTLDRVWPRDKTEKRLITEPERLLKLDYEGKLRRVCEKHDTKFIEYRPQTGSWVFRVEHFSKYGLTDSDEEDDPTPDVLKRQLVANESLQKASAPVPKPPVLVPETKAPGLGGLGGLGGLASSGLVTEDSLYNLHHTSLLSLNGNSKAFDIMDTAEDNTESHSMFLENRAFGVKSPTSELARLENRQSHNVQLMKASLYTDEEMDDDMSVSTGEQLVPISASLLNDQRLPSPTLSTVTKPPQPSVEPTDELPMRPLIVQPYTIVLKYHRKVPPFKNTIAGKLDAACIADMTISKSRHSRVGFGPKSTITLLTTYNKYSELPKSSELSSLDKYLSGRSPGDWSERLVATLALSADRSQPTLQEILEPHIKTLLQWSVVPECAPDACPRLSLRPEPVARLAVLKDFIQYSNKHNYVPKFGVSASYCSEVWKLCDALWGADLENDGIPGTDELSIVNRHKKLLAWFEDAVAALTSKDLAEPQSGEQEDESDTHSVRIWTLLLAGRTLEACKLARQNGDLNMAMLIAQAGGDVAFRGLLARQLSLWRECGADRLMSSNRLCALYALSGNAPAAVRHVGWLRTLHATARYICPQIPSLETVVRTYERMFGADENVDLTSLGDEVDMRPPLPDYSEDYCCVGNRSGKAVLDLRYELIRARAFNQRPKLEPAAYTPDPNDYTLCFLLGAWFGAASVASVVSLAERLEAAGAWHLAVVVLAYHQNDHARASLIKSVISRHVPAEYDEETKSRLDLLDEINIPRKWIYLAQAYRAKYEHRPELEVQYLLGAEQWNAAHRVLMEQLLPEAVLNDEFSMISRLLSDLEKAAQRHEVAGWEHGGHALTHYIHVCEEILSIQQEGQDWSRVEALRPRLAAACRALPKPNAMSPRMSAARAQMGGRLLRLTLSANLSADKLASLVSALKLPPDCSACATHKITTELAERKLEGTYTALLTP